MSTLLFLLVVLVVAAAVVLPNCGPALVVSRQLPRPDAIVVLASHEWERLPAAARLARLHPRASVLLTVPPVVNDYNCNDCAQRVSLLGRLGVDASLVISLNIRRNGTYGEAEAVLDHCRDQRIRQLLVVTSPYHTRRALLTFRHVLRETGVEVGVHPALVESGAVPARWWRRGYDRSYVAYEWAAASYYAIRFGVSPLMR